MPWYFAVVESQHDIQNPTSADKIRLLGERLGLTSASTVLDVASGRAGPAIELASAFQCHVTCVERSEDFHTVAQRRVEEARLTHLIELSLMDAQDFPFDQQRFDVAMCLGASFIWEGLPGTLQTLGGSVARGGSIVVGEPYWRTLPVPARDDIDPAWTVEYVDLSGTAERFRAAGLEVVTLIDSSVDDWDRYESLHWLAGTEWLREHPSDPDAVEVRHRLDRDRDAYLRWQRELLGWAMFVGRST
jgi:precorrin-6B methylase 2